MLNENDKMLLNNAEIAKEVNQYFGYITHSLNLYAFPDVRVCEELDDIDNVVYKFRNHPSIIKIKERYKVLNFYADLEKPTLLNMPSFSYYNDGRMNLITLG